MFQSLLHYNLVYHCSLIKQAALCLHPTENSTPLSFPPRITIFTRPDHCNLPFYKDTMALGDAQLRRSKEDAASFPASDLWKDSPVLVVVLRRPGCVSNTCKPTRRRFGALPAPAVHPRLTLL